MDELFGDQLVPHTLIDSEGARAAMEKDPGIVQQWRRCRRGMAKHMRWNRPLDCALSVMDRFRARSQSRVKVARNSQSFSLHVEGFELESLSAFLTTLYQI